MRILLTNDDGIHAEGLAVLERIARTLSDDVWIVAPETDQSGLAHSLTLSEPLRLRKVADKHFALRGTPTDCVIMGIREVLDIRPDLVLSGVNAGANMADDVTYSGTIAGAIEGTLQGVRSFALSQAVRHEGGRMLPWEVAEAHAPKLLQQLMDVDLPDGTFLNLNFPHCQPDEVEGTSVTSQGKLDFGLTVEERADGRGLPYYWLRFGERLGEFREGTDVRALKDNRISVTPLKLDLTDYAVQDRVAKALGSEHPIDGKNARTGGFAALVLRLRAEGISDIDLLTAVEQTPRSQFVPPQFADSAYSSRTLPIDCGAFMEGADTVVRLLDRLKVKPGHRVLEVGTGSGFTAAVIGRIAERVLTIDRYKTLVSEAQKRMDTLQLRNVVVRHADGSNGLQGEGTFDRILVTAAFTAMPRFFAEQLVSGGSMIAPLMISDDRCQMVRLTKTGSRFEREDLFDAPYMPIVPKLAAFL